MLLHVLFIYLLHITMASYHCGTISLWYHIIMVSWQYISMETYHHGTMSPWQHTPHLQSPYRSYTSRHPSTTMMFKHYTTHCSIMTPCHKGISCYDFLSRSLDTLDTFLGLCIHTSHFLETACFYLLARLHPL